MQVIYMDNNATTKVADEVIEEMTPYLGSLYGNPSSMHTFGGQIGSAFSGSPSDRVLGFYIGGAVCGLLGLFLALKK